jgi:nucleotide-binding universal stress UspA family protein
VAASGAAQLVVVGSRGYTRVDGPWLGTTADQLLRHVQCPIMIVRC